jgi:hypothetical protein
MLIIEKFNEIPYGEIFETGLTTDDSKGVNMTNSGAELRWVAKKGGGDDWAIYVHFSFHDEDFIRMHGDKVKSEFNIKKLVPCTDEVFSKYRM